MNYQFDEEIGRQGTNCTKWEFISTGDEYIYSDHADAKHGADRVLPMWVADMDFRCPPGVVDALVARAKHGIFGYSQPTASYFEAVIDWHARRKSWEIKEEWIVIAPGVVPALKGMVQSFVLPGEKVLVQRPVYYPFFSAIENNGGEVVSNNLIYKDGTYHMDFEDLAQKAADPAVKMAILCSPHNPIGRVWRKDELARFGEICAANGVLVVSDEVHGDLIFRDRQFTTYLKSNDTFAQNSIICTAASKSFNLAGLKTSNIIIPNQAIREKFEAQSDRNGLKGCNTFGLVATEAAYRHCEGWLEAVMDYVEANYHFMVEYIAENLPQLKVVPLEGTYLAWVDCSGLGLTPAERKKLLMERARVYLDEGELFGPEGEAFERINIACPRATLEEALMRIKRAVGTLELSL